MKHIQESIIGRRGNSVAKEFRISKKDMIGDIEGFPVGVVMKMMEEQEKQGNKPDVTVFQRCKNSGGNRGFQWDLTEAGGDFWGKVIFSYNFKEFYKKYPEYKKYGE